MDVTEGMEWLTNLLDVAVLGVLSFVAGNDNKVGRLHQWFHVVPPAGTFSLDLVEQL